MNQQTRYEVHQIECPGCGRLVVRRVPLTAGGEFRWSRYSCHFCGSNLGADSSPGPARIQGPPDERPAATGAPPHPLQAPAYLGKGPGPYWPPTESSLGPFWDRMISWTAVGLGVLGLVGALSASTDGDINLWWTLASAGYVLGGLLNAYLTHLWRRAAPGSWVRVAVFLVKPVVILGLVVAVVVGVLILVLWVIFCLWAIKERGI